MTPLCLFPDDLFAGDIRGLWVCLCVCVWGGGAWVWDRAVLGRALNGW